MITRALAVILGVFFTSSGVLKLVSLTATAQKIAEYLPLGSLPLMHVIVVLISATEILFGIFLLESPRKEQAKHGAIGVVLLASLFTGIVLSRSALGETGDCGCLGALRIVSPGRAEILKSVLLLGVSTGLLAATFRARAFLNVASVSAVCLLIGTLMVPAAQGIPLLGREWSFVDQPLGDWYGYATVEPTGDLAKSIIGGSGDSSRVLLREDGTPLFRITDTENGAETQVGWLASMYVPVKVDRQYKVVVLEVEYSIDVLPRRIGIRLHNKKESQKAQEFCNNLLSSLEKRGTIRFIDQSEIEVDGSLSNELKFQMVHAINSTTNGVLVRNLKHMVERG